MTYAAILLAYDIKTEKVLPDIKIEKSIMGKISSAIKSSGRAITHSTSMVKSLAKYMQRVPYNKLNVVALTQLITTGKVSNKDALDTLFLNYATVFDKTALTMGYAGASQMKNALMATNGINVANFINGFSSTLKAATDIKNHKLTKENLKNNKLIEFDATMNDNRTYQAETPDRRVESGQSLSEYIHNMPDIFSLDCHLQNGRRHTKSEFEDLLKFVRNKKTTVTLVTGDDSQYSVVLQNFTPARTASNDGLTYNLEFKKIVVGTVELVPITIKPITVVAESATAGAKGSGTATTQTHIINNPASPSLVGKTSKERGIGYVEKAWFLFTNALGFETPKGWK
jgi:hypothetical protein